MQIHAKNKKYSLLNCEIPKITVILQSLELLHFTDFVMSSSIKSSLEIIKNGYLFPEQQTDALLDLGEVSFKGWMVPVTPDRRFK